MDRTRALTKKSEQIYNRSIFCWWLSGYLLGESCRVSGFTCSDNEICVGLTAIFPSVVSLSKYTNEPAAVEVVWLFYAFTTPLILGMHHRYITEFNHHRLKNWVVLFLIGLAAVFISIVAIGLELGSTGGGFGRLYANYFLLSTIYAWSFFVGIELAVFFLIHHFASIMNDRY